MAQDELENAIISAFSSFRDEIAQEGILPGSVDYAERFRERARNLLRQRYEGYTPAVAQGMEMLIMTVQDPESWVQAAQSTADASLSVSRAEVSDVAHADLAVDESGEQERTSSQRMSLQSS